jgi:plastocyanin
MKNHNIVCAGIILAFISFLMISCSDTPEKTDPQKYTVEIRAMQFQPAELSVKKGDTVIFINNDIVIHDVTEEENKKWASLPLSTGQSFNLVVNESSHYYCSIHPVMKGKLVVE